MGRSMTYALVMGIVTVACSSPAPPPADVSGTWAGAWNSDLSTTSPSSGTLTFIIAPQNGSTVSGTGTIDPFGSASLTGTYTSIDGHLSGQLAYPIGTVTFDGTAHGGSLAGTYVSTTGDHGKFSLSHQ